MSSKISLDELAKANIDCVAKVFPDMPLCHLDVVLKRFFKCRMYWAVREMNAKVRKDAEEQRSKKGAARASKSMFAKYAN